MAELVKKGLMKRISFYTDAGRDEIMLSARQTFDRKGPAGSFVFAKYAPHSKRFIDAVLHIDQTHNFEVLKEFFKGCKHLFIFDANFRQPESHSKAQLKAATKFDREFADTTRDIKERYFPELLTPAELCINEEEEEANFTPPPIIWVCPAARCSARLPETDMARHKRKCKLYQEGGFIEFEVSADEGATTQSSQAEDSNDDDDIYDERPVKKRRVLQAPRYSAAALAASSFPPYKATKIGSDATASNLNGSNPESALLDQMKNDFNGDGASVDGLLAEYHQFQEWKAAQANNSKGPTKTNGLDKNGDTVRKPAKSKSREDVPVTKDKPAENTEHDATRSAEGSDSNLLEEPTGGETVAMTRDRVATMSRLRPRTTTSQSNTQPEPLFGNTSLSGGFAPGICEAVKQKRAQNGAAVQKTNKERKDKDKDETNDKREFVSWLTHQPSLTVLSPSLVAKNIGIGRDFF
jgi:hypothetical protein